MSIIKCIHNVNTLEKYVPIDYREMVLLCIYYNLDLLNYGYCCLFRLSCTLFTTYCV